MGTTTVWDRALDDARLMAVVRELPTALFTDAGQWPRIDHWMRTAPIEDIIADVDARRPAARAAARAARDKAAARIAAGERWSVTLFGRATARVEPFIDNRPTIRTEDVTAQLNEYSSALDASTFFAFRAEGDIEADIRVRTDTVTYEVNHDVWLDWFENDVFLGHMRGQGAYGEVEFRMVPS